MSRQSPDFTELTIDLEVYNLKHLTSIISQLRAKKVVAKAERSERISAAACRLQLLSASALTSITSPPCVMRAAERIPIR